MKSTQQKSMEYMGANINYYTAGDKKDNTIVFLHPAFCDSEIFCQQVDYFVGNHYLIFVDMIGHGYSQQSRPAINMGNMPEIIKCILDTEDISSAHMVGVSLGSLVAQGFAHYYPSSTRSVTVAGGYSIHKDNAYIQKAQGKKIGKWLIRMIFSMKSFRQMVAGQSVHTQYGREVFIRSAQRYTRKSFMSMNGMDKIMIPKDDPVSYSLLIICAEHDIDLSKQAAKRHHQLEPNSSYAYIDDAGHCSNIDKPDVFNDVLSQFLQQH